MSFVVCLCVLWVVLAVCCWLWWFFLVGWGFLLFVCFGLFLCLVCWLCVGWVWFFVFGCGLVWVGVVCGFFLRDYIVRGWVASGLSRCCL